MICHKTKQTKPTIMLWIVTIFCLSYFLLMRYFGWMKYIVFCYVVCQLFLLFIYMCALQNVEWEKLRKYQLIWKIGKFLFDWAETWFFFFLFSSTNTESIITLIYRVSFQLQNTIFPHGHHQSPHNTLKHICTSSFSQ